MKVVILGLSITSSWGNGHATTYRSLVKGLYKRGHKVLFLERDVPWYSAQRDFSSSYFCTIKLYESESDLHEKFRKEIETADLVIVGSYVPEGVSIGNWVLKTARGIKAFYDIDTPVTLAKLEDNDFEYLHPDQIPKYDLYLSFSGGRVLDIFTHKYGSQNAKPLYCSVDPEIYYPEDMTAKWDLGYLGTYSADRQPVLKEMLIDPAEKYTEGKFVVAGPQYPPDVTWPFNVDRIDHLPPISHRTFYNKQRFALNITRKEMIKMGHSPSVRLFEAASCGIPVITDYWEGLDDFFQVGYEILVTRSSYDIIEYLKNMPEEERRKIGKNARKRVLNAHTGETRAIELELYVMGLKVKNMVQNKV